VPRLCGLTPWRRAASAILLVVPWIAGCTSTSTLLPARDNSGDATGSIRLGNAGLPISNASFYLDDDLASARTAAEAMLDHEEETSASWNNPVTGAHGTITRVASAYTIGGTECRDFLSSYVREDSEAWLQGQACRNAFGHWGVRELQPWRRHG
jgi:surface antigen